MFYIIFKKKFFIPKKIILWIIDNSNLFYTIQYFYSFCNVLFKNIFKYLKNNVLNKIYYYREYRENFGIL